MLTSSSSVNAKLWYSWDLCQIFLFLCLKIFFYFWGFVWLQLLSAVCILSRAEWPETRKTMQAELISTNIVTSYIHYLQIVDIDSSTYDARNVPRTDYALHKVRIIWKHWTKSIWKLLLLLYRWLYGISWSQVDTRIYFTFNLIFVCECVTLCVWHMCKDTGIGKNLALGHVELEISQIMNTGYEYWALTELKFSRRAAGILNIWLSSAPKHQYFCNRKFKGRGCSTVVGCFSAHIAYPRSWVQCLASPPLKKSNISL